ncbi:MAG: flagellin, partial [Gemmatimonadaceae bacterium]|nr:flagellin [Gemmatimonadaceae bacterium]
ITQTINVGQILDTNLNVATGTTAVANFDRLGIQVTLAGSGVANATGSYVDGDLDTQTLIVSAGTGGSFQVGPDDGINNRIEVSIDDMRASGPRLNLNTTSVATLNSSRGSISQIDEAINKVSGQRGDLGAVMNRLAFTISFTENSIENIQNSEASISDADIAFEVSRFTRAQVLSQASTAMLAQANVVPQTALSLLQ